MRKIYKNSREYICEFCKEKFFGRDLFKKHRSECGKKSGLSVDSLGRIIIPGRAKKSMETFKKKVKEGTATFSWTGKHHTEDTRKKLSESRIKYLETNPNHGLKWYTINGIQVQGTWEKKFAEYLTSKNILWERKRIPFLGTHRYTPDFYCPERNIYFEVKGFRRDRDIYKMYLVLKEYPDLQIKMIERVEINNLDKINIFSLPNFQDKYKFEDIDLSSFKNVWN